MRRNLIAASVGLVGILLVTRLLSASGTDAPVNLPKMPASVVAAADTGISRDAEDARIRNDALLHEDSPRVAKPPVAELEEPAPVAAMVVPAAALVAPAVAEAAAVNKSDFRAGQPVAEPQVVVAPNPVPEQVFAAEPLASRSEHVNGVPVASIVVLNAATEKHVREIYAHGQLLGRNPQAFSKVGDSTMAWPPFLADFEDPAAFELGPFSYLQPAIEHLAGSFGRDSVAVRKGMHTWSEFDPEWAEPELCAPGEGPLACELRLHNPSVAIIRLGANDALQPELFEQHMRRILDYCIEQGVVPVLGTKPDRIEGPENTINHIVRRLTIEYRIPLWDYDLVAGTVPGRGLADDNLHMLAGETHDFTSPAAYTSGDPLEDLTGLMMLEAIRRLVAEPAT